VPYDIVAVNNFHESLLIFVFQLACGNSEGVIRFYKWPAFEFVSQIEIQSILVPPNYESGRSMSDMFQV
jgi:hypothetical protein